MKYDNNVKYYCMIRDLFHYMSIELVNKYSPDDKYMVEIYDKEVEKKILKRRMDYGDIENLIQDIAQSLFEKGKYHLKALITYDDENNIEEICFCVKFPEKINSNQKEFSTIIRNDSKIINNTKRKKILSQMKEMNEYQIENYNSAEELNYFSIKNKNDMKSFIKITKNLYIPNDTPEEITTYYHNYRLIKTRILQVKLVKYIIREINKSLQEIIGKKDIIQYTGIEIEELDKYMKKLKENLISMIDLSNKLMKVEKI